MFETPFTHPHSHLFITLWLLMALMATPCPTTPGLEKRLADRSVALVENAGCSAAAGAVWAPAPEARKTQSTAPPKYPISLRLISYLHRPVLYDAF